MKEVIILTGAGQIGMAVARRIGYGKKIIIGDKNIENAQNICNTMNMAGYDATPFEMNLASRTSIRQLINEAQNLGRVSMLINAAGVSPSQVSVETILKVDLYGTAILLEEVGKIIEPGGVGVTISSQSGHRMPALTPEEDTQLATTPTEDLLKLEILQPQNIRDTLHAYQMAKRCNVKRVMVQASPQFRLNEQSLSYMYVRGGDGFLSPLSEYVTLKKINGPEYLTHFNLFPGIRINGTPAAGYSSGQALQAISEVAARTLPVGYGYELSGMSREESSQGNTTAVILIISMVFIYLILSSLYESLLIPFAILLVIPFGLLGSFVLASVFDIENNIYMQTGLVMLIGMLAKTAILLTEVAVKLRRENGLSITAAALAAARLRFRPIVMTATVMIFGMLPLVFSTGAGAKGDISIGMGVLGGMIVGTPALLFLVPVLFCLFEKYDKKR